MIIIHTQIGYPYIPLSCLFWWVLVTDMCRLYKFKICLCIPFLIEKYEYYLNNQNLPTYLKIEWKCIIYNSNYWFDLKREKTIKRRNRIYTVYKYVVGQLVQITFLFIITRHQSRLVIFYPVKPVLSKSPIKPVKIPKSKMQWTLLYILFVPKWQWFGIDSFYDIESLHHSIEYVTKCIKRKSNYLDVYLFITHNKFYKTNDLVLNCVHWIWWKSQFNLMTID